jgi:hypothetical protein
MGGERKVRLNSQFDELNAIIHRDFAAAGVNAHRAVPVDALQLGGVFRRPVENQRDLFCPILAA